MGIDGLWGEELQVIKQSGEAAPAEEQDEEEAMKEAAPPRYASLLHS